MRTKEQTNVIVENSVPQITQLLSAFRSMDDEMYNIVAEALMLAFQTGVETTQEIVRKAVNR